VEGMIKKLYRWVTGLADKPYGGWALCAISFAESSFFPVPPDVLQIPLTLGKPHRAFFYALVSLTFSVLGGIFGYYIGFGLMEAVGKKIISFYHLEESFNYVGKLYNQYAGWAVAIAGFTPIPYKAFTISAGAFRISMGVFIIASIIGRGARFFLVATLLFFFGEKADRFIYNHLNKLAIAFVILFIAGWVILGKIIK
jgi:membrane protein YqaA with SNARE-associated domain